MSFEPIAELAVEPASASVYEEGWQSWSATGVYRADATSPRPRTAKGHTMGWRGGFALPEHGFQGEGLLGVSVPGEGARAWLAADPGAAVASIRLEAQSDRLLVSADGPVRELAAATLDGLLCNVGDALRVAAAPSIPAGWSSWSCYFRDVTEADVTENLDAAQSLDLPVEIVQIDDGWQAEIGDWLDVAPRFGSLETIAQRIAAAGCVPGIWTAPFLVGSASRVAAEHPDWLVGGACAGENWGQTLHVLDVTHPDAAAHLERVYRRLAELGFGLHKLDFLYAGALEGNRRADCSGLDGYREGLRIIREAAGDATLLGCGAPILPSIGLVDAMRVGGDVIGTPGDMPEDETSTRSIEQAIALTSARWWMHARLWASDPDHLLARPEIAVRDRWAAHVARFGGLVLSSDRLNTLDAHGLELTRGTLRPSSGEPLVTPLG